MTSFTRDQNQKTKLSRRYFVCLLLVLSGSLFIPTVAFAAIPTQTLALYSLPMAKTVPKRVKPAMVRKVLSKKPEARLMIPAIKVNATIKEMGVTSAGAMDVPGNRTDVGWYSSGTRPGKTGSAVIGGHNEWGGKVAVFEKLDQLVLGDVLSVIDAQGAKTSYVVHDIRTFEASDTKTGIFASESGANLNLITCSGVYDPKTKTYTTRLVIYTSLM